MLQIWCFIPHGCEACYRFGVSFGVDEKCVTDLVSHLA